MTSRESKNSCRTAGSRLFQSTAWWQEKENPGKPKPAARPVAPHAAPRANGRLQEMARRWCSLDGTVHPELREIQKPEGKARHCPVLAGRQLFVRKEMYQ